MEHDVGERDLLQRGPERGHQVRGQLLDESHRVGQQHVAAARQAQAPRRRVQRGEQRVLGPHPGPGQRVDQRGLARVRVAHDRHRRQVRPLPARPLLDALRAHLRQLLLQVAHALADAPALDLDLGLAGAAARADAAHLPVVVVRADQPRQQVPELGRLDLQPALTGAGVLGEDVQDQLGPVHHPQAELLLQVALLAWAQVLVADHQVQLQVLAAVADLVHLAAAHEQGRLDLAPALDVGPDHLAARGPGEFGQLPHLLAERLRRRPRQLDADQVSALARRRRLGQIPCSRRNPRIPGTGSAVASNHVMPGLRRSHRSWRRAYRRLARAITSGSSSSVTSPRMCISASA